MRRQIEFLEQEHATTKAIYRKAKASLIKAEDKFSDAGEALNIAQQIAQTLQEHVHGQIAAVVTRCLESVFPDNPYEFRLTFERKRNRTECVLSFVRDGQEIDPMTASGGGVVDVACFAQRLAALMLSRPEKRRVLILDEPFKFVSAEYRENIKQMIETLSEELDVQFINITHIEELQIGKVIEL